MFGTLIRKAQATVDSAIDQLLNRLVVAVPFLVAAGFATAALSQWLARQYGDDMSNVILAGGFAGLGVLSAIGVGLFGRPRTAESDPAAPPADAASPDADPVTTKAFELSEADREVALAALTSLLPAAVPGVARALGRNLPLVLLLLVVGFVLNRIFADRSSPAAAEGGPVEADMTAAAGSPG